MILKREFFPEKPYQILYQGERKNTKTIGENGIQNINATGKTGEFFIGKALATHSTDVLAFIW